MPNSQHVISAVLANQWAMLPAKLDEITEFLNMRENGIEVSAEQIQAAMAQQQASSFAALMAEDNNDEGKPLIVDGVQVMQLFGTLGPRMNLMMSFSGGTSTQQFAYDLGQAAANDKVKTILIENDSPGGVVAGTEEARQAILQAREAGKRVVVVGRNLMASAAYYIGASATEVFATPSTEVGSIGVYAIVKNVAKAMEESGVKFNVFRAGDLKAADNPYEELTPERKAALQKRVDAPYQMFLAAVAEDRGVATATVIERFGRGSVMLAEAAKAAGMIDDVALIQDVFDEERRRNQRGAASTYRAATAAQQRESTMNAQIKAALFAHGLIDAIDAEDSICQVALNAYFKATGADVPSDDAAVLAALTGSLPKDKPAPNVEKAHDREMAEAKEATLATERDRVANIQATAEAFGVDEEVTNKAIASDMSHEDFVKEARKAAADAEKPIDKITETGSGEERWASDAVDALAYRVQRANNRHDKDAPEAIRRMAGAPLVSFAEQSLIYAGEKVDRMETPEDIAERAMGIAGAERKAKFFSPSDEGPVTPVSASGGPYDRPGAFPNLLSNLANKILDDAIVLAGKKYPDWTATYPGGLPNFKPAPIVNKGQSEELAEVMDAEEFKQLTIAEECLSWLFLRRYGNKIGFTPVMVANDDMNALTEDAYALGEAWETTINRLCLGILTGNGALLDTYSLFDNTNHANHIDSGAVISDTQIAAHETKYAAQTGIGTTQTIEATLNTVLVPVGAVHQAARRTLLTYEELRESKQAATTANVGLYRGQVAVVPEPALNGTSAAAWYSFCDPTTFRRATVIRAYFRGYGQRGRRERWFDPETKTTWVSLEGRIGAAAKSYRYAIKDDGE